MDLLSVSLDYLALEEVQQTEKYVDVEAKASVLTKSETPPKQRLKAKPVADHSCQKLRHISLDEVAWHDTHDNCWIVVYDYVYDCTEFIASHPGGQDVLLEYAGRDATLAFVGTGHSRTARQALEEYRIGELPPGERIFRTPGGVRMCDV